MLHRDSCSNYTKRVYFIYILPKNCYDDRIIGKAIQLSVFMYIFASLEVRVENFCNFLVHHADLDILAKPFKAEVFDYFISMQCDHKTQLPSFWLQIFVWKSPQGAECFFKN